MSDKCPKCGAARWKHNNLLPCDIDPDKCRIRELEQENARLREENTATYELAKNAIESFKAEVERLRSYKKIFDMLTDWMEGYQQTNDLDKQKTREADAFINAWQKQADQIADLKAQLAEARRDVERLDWLENLVYPYDGRLLNVWLHRLKDNRVRAAIDAARKDRK